MLLLTMTLCLPREGSRRKHAGDWRTSESRNFFDALPKYWPGQDYVCMGWLCEPVAALLLFYNRIVEYYTPVFRKEYQTLN